MAEIFGGKTLKCIVCGNELGNSIYCQMCGADNGAIMGDARKSSDNMGSSGDIYGGNSDYAYKRSNILISEQQVEDTSNSQSVPEGTIVLTYDEIVNMSQSGALVRENEKSKEVTNNIIPEYERPKSNKELKKETKELKKSQQGYVNIVPFVVTIVILGVLLIGVTALLIYYVFFGRKEYIEIMQEVSASIYIDDKANQQILSCDGGTLKDLNNAEVVAQNNESALFMGTSGNLVHRHIDGRENDMGMVTDYFANDDLTTVVCLIANEEESGIDVWYDEVRYNVENQLNSVNDVVMSDKNGYFAFFNEYETTYWEENERLEAGGEYITVVHRDIYLVNGNGESKMIYSTEDNNIVINYVTNNGYVFFTEENKNTTYIVKDGEEKSIGFDCENIIYYEDIDQYIMIDGSGDLYYGVVSSRTNEAELIATNVDSMIDIGGNQMQDGYGNVGRWMSIYEGGYSYSDTPQIVYGKNENTYFIRPEYMKESVIISGSIDKITDIYSWNNEKVYFIMDDSFGLITLTKRVESEEEKDSFIETWSEYRIVNKGIDGKFSILADGSLLYGKNGNLYGYGEDKQFLLRENIQNFCANDNSSGYMYVKDDALYYSYGLSYEEDTDRHISDVTGIDCMISNNHTVYYYSAEDENVYCVDMESESPELLIEGIKATNDENDKLIIVRESTKYDIQ